MILLRFRMATRCTLRLSNPWTHDWWFFILHPASADICNDQRQLRQQRSTDRDNAWHLTSCALHFNCFVCLSQKNKMKNRKTKNRNPKKAHSKCPKVSPKRTQRTITLGHKIVISSLCSIWWNVFVVCRATHVTWSICVCLDPACNCRRGSKSIAFAHFPRSHEVVKRTHITISAAHSHHSCIAFHFLCRLHLSFDCFSISSVSFMTDCFVIHLIIIILLSCRSQSPNELLNNAKCIWIETFYPIR